MESAIQRPAVPFFIPSIEDEEIAAAVETLRSGWLTMGAKTQAFEGEFALTVESPFAVAVSSATAGLHLGLNAMGIGPGDEVLVPTFTFAATGAAVAHAGAVARLVDCDPDTLNISVADAARRCGPKTRAIVPVHFAGHPCPMDDIQDLAAARGLQIMEDAAHALPAKFGERMIGSLSPVTVFSFYATKNITTGEGGMVTTADPALNERMRSRRLHGMTQDAWRRYAAEGSWRYDVSYPGFKYNMTDIAASMGRVQLRRMPALQDRRVALVERYRAALSGIAAIELPHCRPGVEHAWHLFVIRLRLEELSIGRDAVMQALKEEGIGTSVHFIPLHEHSYYREVLRCRAEDYPNASAAAERIISLPLYPRMEFADIDRVAGVLEDILRRHRR